MANPNFNPTMSSNDIWHGNDPSRCITDDLDTLESDVNALEADVSALETDKADADHTHTGYATTDHTHTGYAVTGHTHDYAAANHTHSGYASTSHTHSGYASTSHTHSGYASTSHGHSYNDLSDKPTIPSAYTHPTSHPASMITGLATVATSGSYNDLTNKPTIPTIPASLPANGGNADTVDGKHASDFATASHTHNTYALVDHTHSTAQNILWQGNFYMNASQSVTLSQAISAQRNGIVLVFSKFNVSTNESENTNIYCHFIPKQAVALFNGCGHTISEHNTASVNWLKYLYINDTTITGHALNAQYGTAANGVTYDNRERVLRYVIGV